MDREFPLLTLQQICIGHAINIWTEGMMCNDWQLWWMLAIHSSLDRHSFICDQVCRIYWLFDIHTIVTSSFLKDPILLLIYFFYWIIYFYSETSGNSLFLFIFFLLISLFIDVCSIIHMLVFVWRNIND